MFLSLPLVFFDAAMCSGECTARQYLEIQCNGMSVVGPMGPKYLINSVFLWFFIASYRMLFKILIKTL